jgi:hypothetical protein
MKLNAWHQPVRGRFWYLDERVLEVIIVKNTTMRGHSVQEMVSGPTISAKLDSSAFQRLVSPGNVRLSLTSSAQMDNVLLIRAEWSRE